MNCGSDCCSRTAGHVDCRSQSGIKPATLLSLALPYELQSLKPQKSIEIRLLSSINKPRYSLCYCEVCPLSSKPKKLKELSELNNRIALQIFFALLPPEKDSTSFIRPLYLLSIFWAWGLLLEWFPIVPLLNIKQSLYFKIIYFSFITPILWH